MKCRFLAGLLVVISFCFLTSCTSNFSSSSDGLLFVATQGNSSVYSFAIDLSNGSLTAINKPVGAQGTPRAMVLSPDGTTLYGVNAEGSVWSAPVNTDGTLGAVTTVPFSGVSAQDLSPQDIIVDSSGKFLFVANQGNAGDPASGSVLVFAISGTGITQVGAPVPVAASGATLNPGPSALAVTSDAKFLYVADTFDSSVAAFSVDASGNLTPVTSATSATNSVVSSPSGLQISPGGAFLYVTTFGTNQIFGYIICDQAHPNTCHDVNSPDGSLTAIAAGFPVSAGTGPTRMATDAAGPFLFAVGQQSNQILPFKISSGSGALTAASPANLSVGTAPASVVTRPGSSRDSLGNGINYVYVANAGSASISSFSYDSSTGSLTQGPVVATASGQPVALAAK
ncbi:MAG TPA: beta-propeller fold lactonase family protein [Terriglobales bacterium]|nr:beta-propeller fold lactonase family protein [Terriglobales bacterium]